MILLESGANTVYVTLKEKATLASPLYVFVFVNDFTGEKFMVFNTDTSTDTDRYNKFTITVQASPTWTSGEVELSKYGEYSYYAYEYDDTGGLGYPNLNYATVIAADILDYVPDYFETEVETGKMTFQAPTTTNTYFADVTASVKAYGS